jgi:hypothetical protein
MAQRAHPWLMRAGIVVAVTVVVAIIVAMIFAALDLLSLFDSWKVDKIT